MELSSTDTSVSSQQSKIKHILALNKILHHIPDNEMNDNDKTLVFGNTGSGKSTLIAYALGYDLIAQENEVGELILSARAGDDENAPIIGHGAESQTQSPFKYADDQNKITYWDCPGYKDTNGPGHEISHVLQMKKLSTLYKKVKIMLVVSNSDISDRGGDFRKILSYLVPWTGSQDNLEGTMILVVTKSKPHKRPDQVRKQLQIILNTYKDVSQKPQEAILQAFINEQCPIIMFPEPICEGPIEKGTQGEIVNSLKHTGGIDPSNLVMEFSDTSKLWLNDLADYLEKEIEKSIDEGLRHADHKIRREIKDVSSYKEAEQNVRNIQASLNVVSSSTDLKDFSSQISSHFLHFTSIQQESIDNLRESIECLDIIQNTLFRAVKEKPFWAAQLAEASRKISSLLETRTSLNEYTKTINIEGSIISLNLVKDQLREDLGLNALIIFCSNTLFLDADLKLPGADLVIIAPFWRVVLPTAIDLSGQNGKNGDGRDGIHGRPGRVGGNGGNFTGRASEVFEISNLTINLNGGSAGDGAAGIDGADGKNGRDGYLMRLSERDKAFLVRQYRATFGEGRLESVLKLIFPVIDYVIFEYKSKGKRGEDGRSAGMGGCGGYGGYPGKIDFVIMNQESGEATKKYGLEISAGKKGCDGESGKLGRGGQGGRTYSGTYQKAKFLSILRGYDTNVDLQGKTGMSKQDGDNGGETGEAQVGLGGSIKNRILGFGGSVSNYIPVIGPRELIRQATNKVLDYGNIMKGDELEEDKEADGEARRTADNMTEKTNQENIETVEDTEDDEEQFVSIERASRQAGDEIARRVELALEPEVLVAVEGGAMQEIVQDANTQNGDNTAFKEALTQRLWPMSLFSPENMYSYLKKICKAVQVVITDEWLKPIEEKREKNGKDGNFPAEKNSSGLIIPKMNSNRHIMSNVYAKFNEYFNQSEEYKEKIVDSVF